MRLRKFWETIPLSLSRTRTHTHARLKGAKNAFTSAVLHADKNGWRNARHEICNDNERDLGNYHVAVRRVRNSCNDDSTSHHVAADYFQILRRDALCKPFRRLNLAAVITQHGGSLYSWSQVTINQSDTLRHCRKFQRRRALRPAQYHGAFMAFTTCAIHHAYGCRLKLRRPIWLSPAGNHPAWTGESRSKYRGLLRSGGDRACHFLKLSVLRKIRPSARENPIYGKIFHR